MPTMLRAFRSLSFTLLAFAAALCGACSDDPSGPTADGGADTDADTDSDTDADTDTDTDTDADGGAWVNPGCDAAENVVADDLRVALRIDVSGYATDTYEVEETLTVTPPAAGNALTFFGERFEMGEASVGYAYDDHTATFCVGAFEAGDDVSVTARFTVTAASQDDSIMGLFGLAARWNGSEVVVGPFTEPYNSNRWMLSTQSQHAVDAVHDDSPSVQAVDLTVTVPDATWTVVGPGGPAVVDGLDQSFSFDKPMPLYALSFAASPTYETFQVGTSESGVEVWAAVPPGLESAAEDYFPAAVTAIDDMERDIGPWEWGDTLFLATVPGLGGGMEHTTVIWLGSDVLTEDYGDFVVVHETVHHWWGDNVRFADWPHFWLAEGFDEWSTNFNVLADIATTSEFDSNKQYYYSVAAQIMSGGMGTVGPLRFGDEADMGDIFDGSAPSAQIYVYYYYGAVFLQMVNLRLERDFGTDLNTMLSDWFDAESFQSVTTEQFLAFLGTETGDSGYWTALFDDWVYASPTPTLRYDDYSYAGGEASMTLTRTGGADQDLDALDVVFTAGGTDYPTTVDLPAGTDTATATVALPSAPTRITVDPEGFYLFSLSEGGSWSGPSVHDYGN
jgi:aminopeptidase N